MKDKLIEKIIAFGLGVLIIFILYSVMIYRLGYSIGKESVTEIKIEQSETKEPELVSLGMFEITAYCPCIKCCGKTDGITASDTKATAGRTIAADISIYPYGTELYINGNKYIVEDKGGSIKGNKIDIFFATHQEALQWGRQQVEVFIYQ